MAYGDKNLFNNSFKFIVEKFDFPVEMPPEKDFCEFIPLDMNEIFFIGIIP